MSSLTPPRFCLASASPRRAELLRAAGFVFDVVPADVDEAIRAGEAADDYAMRVALDKGHAVAARVSGIILSADTVVVINGQILGKPADTADATRMLRLLSGRTHEVLTAVVLTRPPAGAAAPLTSDRHLERTSVTFGELTLDEITWYVASGEPADKAGAYAVQGLASRFVTSIHGSYSNVVGLPISVVYRMLGPAGGPYLPHPALPA